jgi:fructose-1,6-bisphosphatase/sedoheptulose 1,7-bisphosphatase-like protein
VCGFSKRALAPSLTRITVAAAVGAALHIGQGDHDLVDACAAKLIEVGFQLEDTIDGIHLYRKRK